MGQLDGRRFIVTGGSRGIGRAVARSLVRAGAGVAITARDRGRLEEAARDTGAHPIVADVAVEADVERSVEEAADRLGGLDGLVNNAGIGTFAPIDRVRKEDFERVLAVNVVGAALMTRAVVPHLARGGGGDVINVASTSALKGDAGGTVYCASKFALRGMTLCWQAELRKHDVRVVLVNPSLVQTGFGGDAEARPKPHLLHAEDVADVVLSAVTLHRRGFVPEVTLFATNPWQD